MVIHYISWCACLFVHIASSALQTWFLSAIVSTNEEACERRTQKKRTHTRIECNTIASTSFRLLCTLIIDGIRYIALYRCHGNCHLVDLLSCHYHSAYMTKSWMCWDCGYNHYYMSTWIQYSIETVLKRKKQFPSWINNARFCIQFLPTMALVPMIFSIENRSTRSSSRSYWIHTLASVTVCIVEYNLK